MNFIFLGISFEYFVYQLCKLYKFSFGFINYKMKIMFILYVYIDNCKIYSKFVIDNGDGDNVGSEY